MNSLRTFVVLLCLALLTVTAPAVSAQAVTITQKGTYYGLKTARILDTRTGLGAPKAPLGAAKTLDLTVTGRGGVPAAGVSAVVVNLTVTGATTSGFLTAYPSGKPRPTSSSINFQQGQTRANIATLPLGTGGKVTIYNATGSVSVIADVQGFYASDDSAMATLGKGNEFTSLPPTRLSDTRTDSAGALDGKAGNNILSLYVDFGADGSLSKSVKAVAVNITAVRAVGSGYLTTWDNVGSPPSTSTLSFAGPAAIANMAVITTSLCPDCTGPLPPPVQFAVANQSTKPVHVIVDLVGVYYNDGTAGLRFSPLPPVRITDSRIAKNGKTFTAKGTQTLTAPASVAGANTVALVGNLTVVRPALSTFMTVWAADQAQPASSNINAPALTTVANGALVPLSGANTFKVLNAAGKADFLIDVSGRFDGSSAGAMGQADGRSGAALARVAASSQRR
jgi:hypothetical protein